jgi:cytochrome c oxidase cbb3-type subunit 3
LTDDIWIYGGDRPTITASITAGRMGRCPAWANKLDAATIKALAVYLWRKVQG